MNLRNRYQKRPITLLIDGECILCHHVTRFVIRRDPARRFRFAALQSDVGKRLLARVGLPEGDRDTFVMIDGNSSYIRSTAALRTLREIGGMWRLCFIGMLVPVRIRDWIYRWIAENRYRWFGRRTLCTLPDMRQTSHMIEWRASDEQA